MLVWLSLSIACSGSRYYRSTVIPSPTVPSTHGEPLRKGQWQASVELNSWTPMGKTQAAAAGPARATLWIPRYQAGVSVSKAISKGVEIGGHGRGSLGEFAWRATTDAKDFDQRKDCLSSMLGFAARFNLPSSAGRIGMSLLTELNLMRIPDYTETWRTSNIWPYNNSYMTDSSFRIRRFLSASIFIQLHLTVADSVTFFALGGLQSYPGNEPGRQATGKYPEPDAGTTRLTVDVCFLPGAGIQWRVQSISLSAIASYPVTDFENVNMGPTVTLQAGFRK